MSKNIYTLYVLECEGSNYYVGVTTNMKRRYHQHFIGAGAKFTARHKPIRIFDQVVIGEMTIEEAEKYENARTIELIYAIGLARARGGRYFSRTIRAKVLRRDYNLLDDCYKNRSNRFPNRVKKAKKKKQSPWAQQEVLAYKMLKRSSLLIK